MNLWWRGFLVGAAAALAVVAVVAGGTRFEAFVRVAGGGGRLLLDARLDEPIVGRVVNVPVGTLGEAAFRKRDWILLTTYEMVLRIRPEAAPGAGRAVQDLQVTVRLPGYVLATNADRTGGGSATWDAFPAAPARLRTLAVSWLRVALLAGAAAAAVAGGRRS